MYDIQRTFFFPPALKVMVTLLSMQAEWWERGLSRDHRAEGSCSANTVASEDVELGDIQQES